MNRYSYAELRQAVEADPTPENVAALGEWLEKYDPRSWNGEYYSADGLRIFPIYTETEPDEYEITGYEIR